MKQDSNPSKGGHRFAYEIFVPPQPGQLLVGFLSCFSLRALVNRIENENIDKENLVEALNSVCTLVHRLFKAQKR